MSSSAVSLLQLLSNPPVFDSIIRYLSLQSLLRLSRSSRAWREFVFTTPTTFGYLDLSRCRGAYIAPAVSRIDIGGNSWRAERMDENLTEDEFFAGPLRGILGKLRMKRVLSHVQVLVLDGLASVTNDLLADIITGDEYRIKLLSIRSCINVNQAKLQQLLQYICRPTRPDHSPRLRGLYFFTDPALDCVRDQTGLQTEEDPSGVMLYDGATLGVLPVNKSLRLIESVSSPWYTPNQQTISTKRPFRSTWNETIHACKGIIAFDAVLCTHMHEAVYKGTCEIDVTTSGGVSLNATQLATLSLGTGGCSQCGRVPNGVPTWGESDVFEFPLLWPPPHSGRVRDAARPPQPPTTTGIYGVPQQLLVSCGPCMEERRCVSCSRWWCPDCYSPKKATKLSDVDSISNIEANLAPPYQPQQGFRIEPDLNIDSDDIIAPHRERGDSVKIFNGLCVEHCLVGEMMSGAGSYGMWA